MLGRQNISVAEAPRTRCRGMTSRVTPRRGHLHCGLGAFRGVVPFGSKAGHPRPPPASPVREKRVLGARDNGGTPVTRVAQTGELCCEHHRDEPRDPALRSSANLPAGKVATPERRAPLTMRSPGRAKPRPRSGDCCSKRDLRLPKKRAEARERAARFEEGGAAGPAGASSVRERAPIAGLRGRSLAP